MKSLLIIIYFNVLLFSQNIDLNLKQFAELVSSQHKVNIIIDDSLKNNKFSFYVQRDNNKIMLPAFKRMLLLKNLVLHYDVDHNFYFIKHKEVKEEKKNIYTIKLNSLVFKDIQLILNQFEDDLKYSYIKNSNSIMMVCTESLYNDLYRVISKNDYVLSQFQLKITVIETNLKELKDRGTEISFYRQGLSDNLSYFLNLIAFPTISTTNIFDGSTMGFSAVLKYLDTNSISSIKSSPSVTVQSGKRIYFSAVDNIPYLSSTSTVNGASSSFSENITYRDVGLKIDLMPIRVKDIVFIDLDFVIESLIGESSQTPSTSKRELKNSFQLKQGQILVLSGLENIEKSKTTYGIPFLMNAPFIGKMFRFDTESEIRKSLSIMIEIM